MVRKRSTILVLILGVATLSLMMVAPQVGAEASSVWNIERLDLLGDVDSFSCLALDSNDNPHIIFSTAPSTGYGDLKSATRTNSAWQTETVDSAMIDESFGSLVLDSAGNPHVTYFDGRFENLDLKYARRIDSGWQTETVDSSGDVGIVSSLALDSNGNPHVLYWRRGYSSAVKYARWTGSAWEIETVEYSSEYVGYYMSLALDSSDNPHITYYDQPNDELKYARRIGSGWQKETVDSGEVGVVSTVGYYSSLALDSSDNIHICYSGLAYEELTYARRIGSGWQTETVDSSGDVGYLSLALDSSDNPHISYHDSTNYPNCALKYATRTNSAWETETVDSSGNVGYRSSLALDSSDNPHISYSEGGVKRLKYAHLGPLENFALVRIEDARQGSVSVTFGVQGIGGQTLWEFRPSPPYGQWIDETTFEYIFGLSDATGNLPPDEDNKWFVEVYAVSGNQAKITEFYITHSQTTYTSTDPPVIINDYENSYAYIPPYIQNGPAPLFPCFIATATYESELSPQVQFLRDFREETVLTTFTGKQFMKAFDNIYYSFSPSVAHTISSNQLSRDVMKSVLYPLIGILQIGQRATVLFGFSPDLGIIIFCLIVSSLLSVVYLLPWALLLSYLKKKQVPVQFVRIAGVAWIASIIALTIAETTKSPLLTMTSGVAFVIITAALTTLLATRAIIEHSPKISSWTHQKLARFL